MRRWLPFLLLSLACTDPRESADLRPPPGFVPPAVRPLNENPAGAGRLGFGAGFFALEVGDKGESWRWMGRHGEVRLANRHSRSHLHLLGWLPLELMGEPPAIQIFLGERRLDSFRGDNRTLDRQYVIEPAQLGSEPSVLLVIETSGTARAPGDTRDLGIAIRQLRWESE